MSEKDVINFPNIGVVQQSPNESFKVRAKSFKVKSSPYNFSQYAATVRAYALAGMPFKDIANAGDFLGDEVERTEVDVPMQNKWQSKVGEIVEDESKVLAWQARGERMPFTRQLASPNTISGKELTVFSKGLVTGESTQDQTIEAVEGIKMLRQDNAGLLNSVSNQEIENNPYLKAQPQEILKAA